MENQVNEFMGTEVPTLSFEVIEENNVPVVVEKEVPQENEIAAQAQLTPQEKQMVMEFVDKIDLSNTNAVLQYGAATQKKMADFSGKALENIKSKDLGEVGDMVADLVTQLKSFDVEEETGLLAFFKKKANKITSLKAKYDEAEDNVTAIADALEGHQIQLLKDVEFLDKLYGMNLGYFKEITMYILAGKEKLNQVRNNELVQLKQKAQISGLPEDAQVVKDYENMCDRFEKKINDGIESYDFPADSSPDSSGAEFQHSYDR